MKLHSDVLGNLPFFSMLAISIYNIYPYLEDEIALFITAIKIGINYSS